MVEYCNKHQFQNLIHCKMYNKKKGRSNERPSIDYFNYLIINTPKDHVPK